MSWDVLEAEQDALNRAVVENPLTGYLLLSEPMPTFTAGRFATDSDRLWSEKETMRRGITVRKISRGGKWTFHGPGQILIYPIISLVSSGFGRHGVRHFLEWFRRSLIRYLTREVGVSGCRAGSPFGIYVGRQKLVSFGIAVRRGVCSHGAALYLSPQGEYFQGIRPCGMEAAAITCLEELGQARTWEEVASGVAMTLENSLISYGNGLRLPHSVRSAR